MKGDKDGKNYSRGGAMSRLIFEEKNKRFSERCWTHSIEEPVKLADLEGVRQTEIITNPGLGRNWLIVKDWSEKSRYQPVSHQKAKNYTMLSPTARTG